MLDDTKAEIELFFLATASVIFQLYICSSCTRVWEREKSIKWNVFFPFQLADKKAVNDLLFWRFLCYIFYSLCCTHSFYYFLRARPRCGSPREGAGPGRPVPVAVSLRLGVDPRGHRDERRNHQHASLYFFSDERASPRFFSSLKFWRGVQEAASNEGASLVRHVLYYTHCWHTLLTGQI